MINTANNNSPAQPDLITSGKNSKPIGADKFASASQLSAELGIPDLDDTFLRNHAKDGIPKPIKNKYPFEETIIALLKFYYAKTADRTELPASYDSMQAMDNALGADKKAIKWLLKNGAHEAQLGGSRIA